MGGSRAPARPPAQPSEPYPADQDRLQPPPRTQCISGRLGGDGGRDRVAFHQPQPCPPRTVAAATVHPRVREGGLCVHRHADPLSSTTPERRRRSRTNASAQPATPHRRAAMVHPRVGWYARSPTLAPNDDKAPTGVTTSAPAPSIRRSVAVPFLQCPPRPVSAAPWSHPCGRGGAA